MFKEQTQTPPQVREKNHTSSSSSTKSNTATKAMFAAGLAGLAAAILMARDDKIEIELDKEDPPAPFNYLKSVHVGEISGKCNITLNLLKAGKELAVPLYGYRDTKEVIHIPAIYYGSNREEAKEKIKNYLTGLTTIKEAEEAAEVWMETFLRHAPVILDKKVTLNKHTHLDNRYFLKIGDTPLHLTINGKEVDIPAFYKGNIGDIYSDKKFGNLISEAFKLNLYQKQAVLHLIEDLISQEAEKPQTHKYETTISDGFYYKIVTIKRNDGLTYNLSMNTNASTKVIDIPSIYCGKDVQIAREKIKSFIRMNPNGLTTNKGTDELAEEFIKVIIDNGWLNP